MMRKDRNKGSDYWHKREAKAHRKRHQRERIYEKEIKRIYRETRDEIQKEIDAFYARYAEEEGISIAMAKRRVSRLDIDEYAEKAKQYVADKDLSPQANREMKLYNLTMKVNRLEMLKAQIGLKLIVGYNALEKYFGVTLAEEAMEEYRHQAGVLGDSVIGDVNSRVVKNIVTASFHNATWSDRIWTNQDLLKSELDKLLSRGLTQGKNPRELARDLRKVFDVSTYEAERLMRTELCRVQTDAQMQSYKTNGFDQYTFIACGIGDVCEICKEIDGKHFNCKDMEPGLNAPPMHPNCVLPDTKIIAPGMNAIMRSEYSGDVIEIGTANGRFLSVTPNHIMLTSRGWIRAKDISKGDKVVCYSGRVEPMVEANPTDYNCVATIEQFFTALIESGGVAAFSVPVSPEDLKGDVVPNSKVDIIPVDCKLWSELDAAGKKLLSDVLFIGTLVSGELCLMGDSPLAKNLIALGLAADGIVSGSSELGVLLRGSTTCRELIGLRTPADYNARLKKDTADYRSAHAEFLRDGIFADSGVIQGDNRVDINILDFGIARDSNVDIVVDKNSLNSFSPCVDDIRYIADTSAGLIEFDDVIDVNVGLFSGHVYDTSCMSTLYIANGIITSNCHCSTAPYEDDDEYDAWMAFLDAGGTTVEWDRYGKKRWRESRKK